MGKSKNKKIVVISLISCIALIIITALIYVAINIAIPNYKTYSIYKKGIYYYKSEEYENAILAFNKITNYRDSSKLIEECNELILQNKYDNAYRTYLRGDYSKAKKMFIELNDYLDSEWYVDECNKQIIYSSACELFEKKEYKTAIKYFEQIKGYKDSNSKKKDCYKQWFGEEGFNIWQTYNVGDIYVFGSYEQDNNLQNGKESIEWVVLKKIDNYMLLFSKNCLEPIKFNDAFQEECTWKTSDVRAWLNSGFINDSFNTKERQALITTEITTANEKTLDTVFMLSNEEAQEYISINNVKDSKVTPFAISKGAWYGKYDNQVNNGYWWLRSLGGGMTNSFTQYVDIYNIIYSFGQDNQTSYICIRPVIWVDITKL